MKVLIHSGHSGNKNVGASGTILEDVLNNDLATIIADIFEKGSWEVIRELENSQLTYDQIVAEANLSKADIFITVHNNASDNSEAKGFEVYYCLGSTRGKKLAEFIAGKLKYNGFIPHGEAVKDDSQTARKYIKMMHTTNMPCILLECCFITNEEDVEMILKMENKIKFCQSIFEGVKNYFI
jgi:N-acetylmuramoyl-L-alanine amidase